LKSLALSLRLFILFGKIFCQKESSARGLIYRHKPASGCVDRRAREPDFTGVYADSELGAAAIPR